MVEVDVKEFFLVIEEVKDEKIVVSKIEELEVLIKVVEVDKKVVDIVLFLVVLFCNWLFFVGGKKLVELLVFVVFKLKKY